MIETTRQAFRGRQPAAAVSRLFLERWSPRAFSTRPVPDDVLASLFEAARWSPSCFNEQPWLFVYANDEEGLASLRGLLVEANLAWNQATPVLALLAARLHFTRHGKPNRHAGFDSGAAWASLALQAHALGLAAHAMAGFHRDRAHALLGLPEDEWDPMCMIAIGYPGDAADLPERLRERDRPSDRKPAADVARRIGRPAGA